MTSPQNISNLPTAVPSATALQQLPGHEKRPINILDKFKGNDQYKQAMAVQPAQDSVKVSLCYSKEKLIYRVSTVDFVC